MFLGRCSVVSVMVVVVLCVEGLMMIVVFWALVICVLIWLRCVWLVIIIGGVNFVCVG